VRSVAAVPVGLTKYREGLPELRGFTAEESAEVIRSMTEMGDQMLETHGSRIFYPSDEWYIKAGLPLPSDAFYEDYPQLENGVGMLTLLKEQFVEAVESTAADEVCNKRTVIATGVDAAPYLKALVGMAKQKWPDLQARVIPIRNDFFGESITVSGLVTGGDLIAQLSGLPIERLILPLNMLRQEGDLFLDDVSVDEVEKALNTKVILVQETDAYALLSALITDEGGVANG
jgi:NifB/MoaA-like Fe-S oxidoreductase